MSKNKQNLVNFTKWLSEKKVIFFPAFFNNKQHIVDATIRNIEARRLSV